MEEGFPEFPEPVMVADGRAWTATFESFDQRKDDLYYIADIHEGGVRSARFMVHVSPTIHPDLWTGPAFIEHVRQAIGKVAATGRTNTEYTGAMSRPDR
jgi:hypothetical protein